MSPVVSHAPEKIGRYFLEDLEIGMRAEFEREVTEPMGEEFARVTGDRNPLHFDKDYARGTIFRDRIAHGMISAGFFSTLFGTVMPGQGSIYLKQNLKFTAPVRYGDVVKAVIEVVKIETEKSRVLFATRCLVNEQLVIDGDALIMVPSRPL
ncbi:MaoC family dehydratase [uncultured Nisaea sp.]|uniref:MaoC family dehydratase n=1 Tax=uncultured Nisaea sp. TaxID=538215 RepID=UPI0030ED6109|tara:strand:+ start:27741 stop:28196 length:456 start_codon:yes stop_codon:yes gene_type:complete